MTQHRNLKTFAAALVAFVCTFFLCATAASAAPGDLDGSWSGDGIQTTANGARLANASVFQADGKLVVAGGGHFDDGSSALTRTYVARYDNEGNLDPTFGTGDVAKLNAMRGSETVRDVAIDSSGRIVVVGFGEARTPTSRTST